MPALGAGPGIVAEQSPPVAAAGDAVLRAAGGQVVRLDAPDTKLVYGKPGFENPFFIASAAGVALRPVWTP
ncbi:hypothetical protein SH611_21800 [Geminicoccaceae bacterium 1502E]|nr:hypothetical protein [Geminicoccaceae bacterium 1502E]